MLDVEFLKKFGLFAGLNDEKLKKLIEIIKIADYPGASTVIRDGDHGDEMFVLLEGEVEISKQMILKMENEASLGKDKSLLRLSSKFFACFGEMALFEENSERSATVTTVTQCKLGIVTRRDFTKLVETDYEMGYVIFKNMARIISDRLKKANKDILKLTTAFVLAVEE